MAHLYRIVPVALHDDNLTVASPHSIDQSVVEELYAFLGLTVQSIVVSEDDFEQALMRYYPNTPDDDLQSAINALDPMAPPQPGSIHIYPHPEHPRESEWRDLAKRIFQILGDEGVERVCLRCSESELFANTKYRDQGEVTESVADSELGLLLLTRLKVTASLDTCEQNSQTGKTEITFNVLDQIVLVETRTDGEGPTMHLSLIDEIALNGG